MGNGFAVAMRKVRRGWLPLSGLVSREDVSGACAEAGYRSRGTVYTPITTILTFLAQLLGADGSCQQAVDGLIAQRVADGKEGCSADTGGYCKARSRLPEKVFWHLARQSGQVPEAQADPELHWQGHRVRVADGSTLKIADTPDNREEYPLQQSLKAGLHYPWCEFWSSFRWRWERSSTRPSPLTKAKAKAKAKARAKPRCCAGWRTCSRPAIFC